MPTRNTAILAAVTLLIGIYAVVFERGSSSAGRNFRGVPIVGEAADIAAVSIVSAAGEIALNRDGERWVLTEPVRDRADFERAEKLIGALVALKKEESLEEDAPSDSEMGLGEGALRIKVTTVEGASGTLVLGDGAGVEETVYGRWDDGVPFVCWRDARDLADVPADTFRDIRLLGVKPENMRRFKIKNETEASLVISREGPGEDPPWTITRPLNTLANPEAVDSQINLVTTIGAREFIDSPGGEVSSAFAAGALTVSVWRTTAKGAVEMRLAKSADGESGYAQLSDREATFGIDPRFVDRLSLDPNDYRDRRLFAFNPKSVLGVQISAKPDFQVNLMQDNAGWQLINGEKRDLASRQRVLRMLKDLSAEEAVEFVADAVPDADLQKWGLDKPTLAIHLATVRQDPDEPVDTEGNPNIIQVPVTIMVNWQPNPLQNNIHDYYATVKGSGTVVKLNRAFPTLVPIRPIEYRSVYLWPSFARERLRSITTSRPPQAPLELKYLAATNDWTGTLADTDVTAKIDTGKTLELMQELSLPLRATSWVAKGKEQAMKALERPVRSLEFVLTDQEGKDFTFGLDIAPVGNNMRGAYFYGRVRGETEACFIDRQTFELLNSQLIFDDPKPAVPPVAPQP